MKTKNSPYIYTYTHALLLNKNYQNFKFKTKELNFLQANPFANPNIYCALKYNFQSGLNYLHKKTIEKTPRMIQNEICNLYIFHNKLDIMIQKVLKWEGTWEVKRAIILIELMKVQNQFSDNKVEITPAAISDPEHNLRAYNSEVENIETTSKRKGRPPKDVRTRTRVINISGMKDAVLGYKDLIEMVKNRNNGKTLPLPNPEPVKRHGKRDVHNTNETIKRACVEKCRKEQLLTLDGDITFYPFIHDEYKMTMEEITEIQTKVRNSDPLDNLSLSINNKLFFYFEFQIINLLKDKWDIDLFIVYLDLFDKTCKGSHSKSSLCDRYIKRKFFFMFTESYLQNIKPVDLPFIKKIFRGEKSVEKFLCKNTNDERVVIAYYELYKDVNILTKFAEKHYSSPVYQELKAKYRVNKTISRVREVAINKAFYVSLNGSNEGIKLVRYTHTSKHKRQRRLRNILMNIRKENELSTYYNE